MSINTTINMKPSLKARIHEISLLYKITKSNIISLIILKIIHNTEIEPCMFESVKYQEKNKSIKWKKLHVSYDEDVYEKANDLRKITKRSVSRIIAEGAERFLEEIIRDLCNNNKRNTDNYPHEYVFKSTFYNGINYFTIFWQFSPLKFLKKYIK